MMKSSSPIFVILLNTSCAWQGSQPATQFKINPSAIGEAGTKSLQVPNPGYTHIEGHQIASGPSQQIYVRFSQFRNSTVFTLALEARQSCDQGYEGEATYRVKNNEYLHDYFAETAVNNRNLVLDASWAGKTLQISVNGAAKTFELDAAVNSIELHTNGGKFIISEGKQ